LVAAEKAASPQKLPTRNPRSGAIDYQMPVHDAAQVASRAAALRGAQAAWLACGAEARAAVLLRFAESLLAERDALTDALAQDTGRWNESVLEIDSTVGAIRRWAREAPALLAPPAARAASIPFVSIEQQARPYALTGIVSPWNFPLLLSMIDATPALMAGCSVLIKPSEITPRFVPVVERALARVPELAAVLGFVTGPGSTGAALIDAVDLLCFTGSVATGRKVAVHAAERFIPAHLELGGKDAAIVCDDADLPRAARAICWASMVNAGQSCMSLERAYVQREVFMPFVAALSDQVRALKFCWPDIRSGQIGPVISDAQVGIVRRHFVDAYARGARAVVGGKLVQQGGGWWCEPTVMVNVTHDMAVVREETFAAILPVMAFDTDSDAVALANDSDFGLSGCVFSGDGERARRIAAQLQAGAISINDASLTALVHDAAKQSFKRSGLGGSRMGAASVQRFFRQQAWLVSDGAAAPWWF
jgi:succinate-semialdehyde dehydrogenase / glutarate-semialdehyde dehydrogenase